jgi:hypothetical protein
MNLGEQLDKTVAEVIRTILLQHRLGGVDVKGVTLSINLGDSSIVQELKTDARNDPSAEDLDAVSADHPLAYGTGTWTPQEKAMLGRDDKVSAKPPSGPGLTDKP